MDILQNVGNTPLIKIENIYGNKYGNVFVKLEEFNAGGSIKSRVGLQMVKDAEREGILKKGMHLIEATGGNTGLGMALAAALKGYRLTLIIPDNFSHEKISTLNYYGANIILSDHTSGPGSHVRRLQEILKEENDYIHLDQFTNLSNPAAHYNTTGREILLQTKGDIAGFICSIGSGGTITGVGTRLKEYNNSVKIATVQPEGCDILRGVFKPHPIEATAIGFIPDFVRLDLIEGVIDVDFEEVQEIRKYICKTAGIFVGLSSGANILAALKWSKDFKHKDNIITVAPDSGRSYLFK